MKAFKDVYINTGDVSITDFINKVTDQVRSSWSRSYENEENSKYLGEIAFSFKRANDGRLPSAGISIFQKDKSTWYIPNVVPLEVGQLDYDEYNSIITDFYNTCLIPAASDCDVNVEITTGIISDEDVVGYESAKLLKSFSSLANKSTGSSHPCDQKRWFAFIVQTCREHTYVDTSDLIRVLRDQGWDENSAHKLAIEFEFARDLIMYMES